ncbi:MAG: hypothetical protein PF542_00315 [Nanoarchaeota archaeon]|jgi:hypothetical protein|nr:hypothetical protein [Nanoarchaeota archaeon]
MKTLKEKKKLEILSYVPYSFLNKNIYSKLKKEIPNHNHRSKYEMRNFVSTTLTTAALGLYGIASIVMGTPNLTKWDEISATREQKIYVERKNLEKDILNKSYNYFDSNLDGQISKAEFKEGADKIVFDNYNKDDFYDMLNSGLKLNQKEGRKK